MIKRNLGSALAGRTAASRKRDMLLKVLTHNVMIIRPAAPLPQGRGLRDRRSYAQLTRFLPDAILDRFERVTLEPPKPEVTILSSARATPPRAAEIRKMIASMWG